MTNLQYSEQSLKTAMLILGAGNSSRLGKPKQLLPINNTTLLNHTIKEALKVSCQERILVLGAFEDEIRAELNQADIAILSNKNWESGMASSIKLGVKWLIDQYDPDQVLITLCDQPFINHNLLDEMVIYKNISSKGIIACSYGGTVGVPVIFDKRYFPSLLALRGKEGAKKLVKQFAGDVGTLYFPQGNIDIDTDADYQAYLREDWSYFNGKNE
jgi:molybdenum cofactor cytidylyltransferase